MLEIVAVWSFLIVALVAGWHLAKAHGRKVGDRLAADRQDLKEHNEWMRTMKEEE